MSNKIRHNTKKYAGLTQERLCELFSYDPETGILRWRARDPDINGWNKRFSGQIAGYPTSKGYLRVGLSVFKKGVQYNVHTIVWIMMCGALPANEIDHVDRNKKNNRWKNLREATTSQNCHNQAKRKNNTSGFKGVFFHKVVGKWGAQITCRYVHYNLGFFDTPEAASRAYKRAAKKLHQGFSN